MTKGNINVSVENIFPLIKKFLYSDHEIFLRELISNATDATLKLKHLTSIGEAKVEYGKPKIEVKITSNNGKYAIFDVLRRRYVALTPEEWVRQHFVHYLIQHKGYPQALMANEVQVSLNGTKKRCDTVLYQRDLSARMIIEYKAPDVEITQAVFDQITRYNMVLKVDYLIVSNGMQHYCCKLDYQTNSYTFLRDIPNYDSL